MYICTCISQISLIIFNSLQFIVYIMKFLQFQFQNVIGFLLKAESYPEWI